MWQFPHFTPNHTPDWDTLTAHFNWLADMAAVPQDPEWHGEGDALTHTKMVADALFRLPEYQALDAQAQHILFAAALLIYAWRYTPWLLRPRLDGKPG